MKTVKLVCPSCSAEMEVDEEKLLLYYHLIQIN